MVTEHMVAVDDICTRCGFGGNERQFASTIVPELTGMHIEKSVVTGWDSRPAIPESLATQVVDKMLRKLDDVDRQHRDYQAYLERRRLATIAEREAKALRDFEARRQEAIEADKRRAKPSPQVVDELAKARARAVDLGIGAISREEYANPVLRAAEERRIAEALGQKPQPPERTSDHDAVTVAVPAV